jgi:hypothetical protein
MCPPGWLPLTARIEKKGRKEEELDTSTRCHLLGEIRKGGLLHLSSVYLLHIKDKGVLKRFPFVNPILFYFDDVDIHADDQWCAIDFVCDDKY